MGSERPRGDWPPAFSGAGVAKDGRTDIGRNVDESSPKAGVAFSYRRPLPLSLGWLHAGRMGEHRDDRRRDFCLARLFLMTLRSTAGQPIARIGEVGISVEVRDQTGACANPLARPLRRHLRRGWGLRRFIRQPPYGRVPGGLPILESVDPFGDTTLPSGVMARPIADCDRALTVARVGSCLDGRLNCARIRSSADRAACGKSVCL